MQLEGLKRELVKHREAMRGMREEEEEMAVREVKGEEEAMMQEA